MQNLLGGARLKTAVERVARGAGTHRWLRQLYRLTRLGYSGRDLLRTPQDAYVLGAEVYVPAWWPVGHPSVRLTVLDPRMGWLPRFVRHVLQRQRPGGLLDRWVRGLPDLSPWVDISTRIERGVPQTIEFALPAPPPAGAEVQIDVFFDSRSGPSRLGLRVRSMWLRGPRLGHADVAIVVLNWNRPRETIACLESLAAADLRGASVLVVDNGSRDGSVDTICERLPDQRILCLPENRGYSGGNNAGIRAALAQGAKAVLILNNDTRVAPDFLQPLVWVLNSDVKAAAVSSAVLRPEYDDMLESAYLGIYWGHGIIRHYGVNALPGEGFGYRREVEVIVGCSVLISAEALNEVGALDESYFAYHEEVDWCFRARAAGYRIYWEPYSRVWHNKSTSTSALGPTASGSRERISGPQLPAAVPLTWNPVQTYLGARNAVRFVRRHASVGRKLYFALSSLYGVPLEFLAAVMRQEPALKIGAWSYRKALRLYCTNPDGLDDPPPSSTWTQMRRLPYVLLRALPRDIRIARREGRLAQIDEHLRGLWDGILDRPLPLERLGLK